MRAGRGRGGEESMEGMRGGLGEGVWGGRERIMRGGGVREVASGSIREMGIKGGWGVGLGDIGEAWIQVVCWRYPIVVVGNACLDDDIVGFLWLSMYQGI